MTEILGFISIALVSLLTYLFALRQPNISNILIIALLVRVAVLLIGHYFITLPDSTADAETFEDEAWKLAKDGFLNVLQNFEGPRPRFISWVIAIPYSLFGRSILMAQSINLVFGMGSVYLSWVIAKKIWDNQIARKVAWTVALFPSLILYSVVLLREVYMVFFLLFALYGIICWYKNHSFKSIVITITGFTCATFFHGAMMVGAIIFIFFVGMYVLKKLFKSLIVFKINLKIFIIFILFLLTSSLYLTNKISVPYLGTFENSTNLDNLQKRTKVSTRGNASWPEWTKINSSFEIIYKAPVRALHVIYAPFPWNIKEPKHLIGMFDGLLYIYLSYLIFSNIKIILKDPVMRFLLIVLITYIFVFAIGVGNFGTGIRHRSKFAVIFILLAAPKIKNIIFLKKFSQPKRIKTS